MFKLRLGRVAESQLVNAGEFVKLILEPKQRLNDVVSKMYIGQQETSKGRKQERSLKSRSNRYLAGQICFERTLLILKIIRSPVGGAKGLLNKIQSYSSSQLRVAGGEKKLLSTL